jgi:protein-tyrosine-phosphatase
MGELPGSVLFACTLNSIRSPMAEALLKHLHGRKVFVDSVGVHGEPIDPFVIQVMAEIGIDVTKHRNKSFEDLADTSFDLIITMSPEAQHRAMEMTRVMACEVEYWPTYDPTIVEGNREAMLDSYRQVRDQILKRVKERFPGNGATT